MSVTGLFKDAEWVIEKTGYKVNDFPEFVEYQWKRAIRHFLHVDNLSIFQLTSIVRDIPFLLAFIAEELHIQAKNSKNSWQAKIAAGIAQRFPGCPIRSNIRYILESTPPRPISPQSDSFSPLQPEHDLSIPLPRNSIQFIDSPRTLAGVYFTGQIIGLDCEWKSELVKYKTNKISIIQIACEDFVYLIDLIALNKDPELDEKLEALMQSDAYKVGVSFGGDIKKLNSSYPHLKAFRKPLRNYIDVVGAYGKCFGRSPGGLAGCCEVVLKKSLCKYEQRSNWENRPLTESQTHYAALDAYVQIVILEKLMQSSGFDVSEFVGGEKVYPLKGFNCDFCGSKLHNKNRCSRGARCKICFMTGHRAANCFS